MKIVVVKPSGGYYCKPDTTLNHNNSDFYCPEGVSALEVIPCAYTHIIKAGKCVAPRFAHRYYDAFAWGLMLVDKSPSGSEAEAAAIDQSSVLDMGWRPTEDLAKGGYAIAVGGRERFRLGENRGSAMLSEAICTVTRRTSLRIGDIIAVELGSAAEVVPGDSLSRIMGSETITINIY